MSNNLHSVNNSGFYSTFMNRVEQNNPSTLDPDCLGIDKMKRYTNTMKEKYISFWRHSLEHSKKLEFYKVFKDEYSTSDYLYQITNFSERRNLVKFKISNHKHVIELGRYQIDYVTRENRSCPLCKSKQISFLVSMSGIPFAEEGIFTPNLHLSLQQVQAVTTKALEAQPKTSWWPFSWPW